jgi:hypothetical protein
MRTRKASNIFNSANQPNPKTNNSKRKEEATLKLTWEKTTEPQ